MDTLIAFDCYKLTQNIFLENNRLLFLYATGVYLAMQTSSQTSPAPGKHIVISKLQSIIRNADGFENNFCNNLLVAVWPDLRPT